MTSTIQNKRPTVRTQWLPGQETVREFASVAEAVAAAEEAVRMPHLRFSAGALVLPGDGRKGWWVRA